MSAGLLDLSPDSDIVKIYTYYSSFTCFISWALAILLFYVIFTQSKEIGSFKWLILNHTIWTIAGVTLATLVKPVILSPYLAGYQAGIFSKTEFITTAISGLLLISLLFNTLTGIMMTMFNRYTVLFPAQWQEIFRKKLVLFGIVACHVIFHSANFIYLFPKTNRNAHEFHIEAIKHDPEFAHFMNESTFFFIALESYSFGLSLSIMAYVALGGCCALIMGIFLYQLHANHQAHFIRDEVQKSLIVTALVQSFTTCLFVIGIPLTFLLFQAFRAQHTALATLIFCMVEHTYCPCDIIATLYFVAPYRRFVLYKIFRRKEEHSISAISKQFQTAYHQDCAVITKTFQDILVENHTVTFSFSYYLTNDGKLIYKFDHTVKSDLGPYIFIDLCLQINGGQITTAGECNDVELGNQQVIINTLSSCSSKKHYTSFEIHYSNTDFTFNIAEPHLVCSSHCELQIASFQAPSAVLHHKNYLTSMTKFTELSIPPPPLRPYNCGASPIMYIFCQLMDNTGNRTVIKEAIKLTRSALLDQNNIISSDVCYVGEMIMQTVAGTPEVDPTTAKNILDIISSENDSGPNSLSSWSGLCISGQRQSPIDITSANVVYAVFDNLTFVDYEIREITDIVNLGTTIQINGFDTWGPSQPYVFGGGLGYSYKLLQIHFHWSDVDNLGSEHTIEGDHFPLEIHFLHVKEGRTLEEALVEPDGLMALGVFASINNINSYNQNPFSFISDSLELMRYSSNGTRVKLKVAAGDFLPQERQSFFRYYGSLTTPDCNEATIWTIMAAPIPITDYQLSLLRKIRTYQKLGYSSNVRSIQPLNGRRVQLQLRLALFNNPGIS
ncbi:hypothetical protein FO519_004270 [Halicephalobus sp. NKZ332]|nr:hypothetical protein FO519_004270 [Halicephalobus sp. NKZ332]